MTQDREQPPTVATRQVLGVAAVAFPLPLAHAGHVLIDLAIFSPILILAVWFIVMAIRDRKDGGDREQ